MTDPTDKELLEFVARFVGWDSIEYTILGKPMESTSGRLIPDYLNDLNAWHRDVWPKVLELENSDRIQKYWFSDMEYRLPFTVDRRFAAIANADARSRCLALYRALS